MVTLDGLVSVSFLSPSWEVDCLQPLISAIEADSATTHTATFFMASSPVRFGFHAARGEPGRALGGKRAASGSLLRCKQRAGPAHSLNAVRSIPYSAILAVTLRRDRPQILAART